MKTIRFTIHGNQENQHGNPVPYFRVTSQSKWSDGSKRYHAWEDFVRAAYIDALLLYKPRDELKPYHNLLEPKPISWQGRASMNLKIHWRDKTHGDSDNVFKGIADALWANDKYLCGSFDYDYSPAKNGNVDVEIIFYDNTD